MEDSVGLDVDHKRSTSYLEAPLDSSENGGAEASPRRPASTPHLRGSGSGCHTCRVDLCAYHNYTPSTSCNGTKYLRRYAQNPGILKKFAEGLRKPHSAYGAAGSGAIPTNPIIDHLRSTRTYSRRSESASAYRGSASISGLHHFPNFCSLPDGRIRLGSV